MLSSQNIKNILIIRPSALGDVARSVPAAVSIKKQFPNAKLHWMVQENFSDIISAHPCIDELIYFNRKALKSFSEFKKFRQWIRQLQNNQYDLVIDLQGLFRSGLISRLTKSPNRLGYKNAREFAHLGYNLKYHTDHTSHAVDQMLTLISDAGIPTSDDLQLYTSQDSQAWRQNYLDKINATVNEYTIIAPTARWLCKCWPIEKYIQTIKQLLETQIAGKDIFILASPAEQDQIQPIREAFPYHKNIHYPKTNISQMMALIETSKIIVCNDSAPLHIAIGFDRAIATIFGPTNPALVGPYKRSDTIIQPAGITQDQMQNYRKQKNDQTLISKVSAAQVWSTIQSQLKR